MTRLVAWPVTDDAAYGSATHCECKVGRGIDAYGLSTMNDELARLWRGEGGNRCSLRDLATVFNERVLDAALADAGVSRMDGEVSNLYRLLTDSDVSTGVRTETRQKLEADGVSVSTVEDHFVSHQTVHTHLTECLGISREDTSDTPEERRRSDRDRIRALQHRTEAVTTDALDRLRESDALAVEGFDVFVDVTVLCDDCGRQSDIGELLDAGGCPCQSDTS